MDYRVIKQQVQDAIHKLLSKKALELDKILNKVLKTLSNTISNNLAKEISKLFNSAPLLEGLKDTITIILRKLGKKDYTLVNAYCPIALENIIAKLVKTIIAKRLAEAAEEH